MPVGSTVSRTLLLVLHVTIFIACAPASSKGPNSSGSHTSRNSVELKALARDEEARFTRAVAAERSPRRLDVESVSATVLVDRARSLVYALQPTLVALDLQTGAERWRLDSITGVTLTRLGSRLLVVSATAPKVPRLVVLDPDTPKSHQTCDLRLPTPEATQYVSVIPFDRSGASHFVWRGHGHLRRGGTPHSERELARYRAGESCGVVAIDTSTCAVTPTPLNEFLLSPPRDKGAAVPIAAEDCRYLSPELEMPAVAASRPGQSDGRVAPSVHIVTTEAPAAPRDCVVVLKNQIEVRDANGNRLWHRPLPDVMNAGRCPGPP